MDWVSWVMIAYFFIATALWARLRDDFNVILFLLMPIFKFINLFALLFSFGRANGKEKTEGDQP